MSFDQNQTGLTQPECRKRAENWLAFPKANLANLFYVRNELSQDPNSTKRIVAFKMADGDVLEMFKLYNEKSTLCIHLGSVEALNTPMTDKPGFTPFIQLYNPEMDKYSNSFDLAFDPTGAIDLTFEPLDGSAPILQNVVTPDQAKGFVDKWKALKNDEIANVVEDHINAGNKRVEFYIFPNADVRDIVEYMRDESHNTLKPTALYLLLGIIPATNKNPVEFRTIVAVDNRSGLKERRSTNRFYEFARPCPPFGHGG